MITFWPKKRSKDTMMVIVVRAKAKKDIPLVDDSMYMWPGFEFEGKRYNGHLVKEGENITLTLTYRGNYILWTPGGGSWMLDNEYVGEVVSRKHEDFVEFYKETFF